MREMLPFRPSALASALLKTKTRLMKITPLAAAAALALLQLSPAAYAQAAAPEAAAKEDKNVLDTVVVTAQGRKENPLKIPYNITAISGDDLQDRRITDQTELLREVSGASVVDRGYRNSGVVSGVTVRGLNVNGAALGDYQTSAAPGVSTYINQTPIYANFLIKDLERVEILRGPQGTLYGSGSLGGTLRYITQAPDLKTFGGRVEANFGQTDGSEQEDDLAFIARTRPGRGGLRHLVVVGRPAPTRPLPLLRVNRLRHLTPRGSNGVPVHNLPAE